MIVPARTGVPGWISGPIVLESRRSTGGMDALLDHGSIKQPWRAIPAMAILELVLDYERKKVSDEIDIVSRARNRDPSYGPHARAGGSERIGSR